MAFNLGAFAGGLVSGGLKTYTTLKEQERADAAEARDKARFEEEQRKIDLQRQAEDIARQATIPTTGTGTPLKDVVAALPIGSPSDPQNAEYRQKFNEVFSGLTPQQQALVLRQYGDTSTPGGAAFEADQRALSRGASGIPAGLNTAVVREETTGERSVLPPEMDEKAVIARHKQLAMASGNPLAIKAAHEAEATMLNRQVAQQQLDIGAQNIELGKYNIKAAKTAQEFKDSWTAEMTAAKEDHFKLMKQIDTSLAKNPTLQSLVDEYGPKLKEATGQTYSVQDGKVVTTGADGKPTVVASDVAQAGTLLKQAAIANFAQDFQDRILAKGLFEKPADLAAFIKDKQDFVIKTGTLATQQIIAEAATKNAESAAVAAGAARTRADADKAKVDAELSAKIPEAQAALLKAQASGATSMADYHKGLLKIANEKNALDAEARVAMKAALADFDKLTPEEQIGPKGAAMVAQAAAIAARKTGDLNGLLTSITREQKAEAVRPTTPADVAKFVETFGASPSSFNDGNGIPIPIGKLSPAQAMQEMQGMMGGKGATGSGLPTNVAPPPPPKAGAAIPAASATSVAPAGSTVQAAIDAAKKPVDATANVQSALANAKYDAATQNLIDNDPTIKDARATIKKLMGQGGTANITKATEMQNKLDAYIANLYKTGRTATVPPAATTPVTAPAAAIPLSEDKSAELRQRRAEAGDKAVTAAKQRKAETTTSAAVVVQAENLWNDMDIQKSRLDKDPKNWALEARYKAAKEKYEAFKKANNLP